MKILVLGFYHRKNFGDDLFEYIFDKYLTLNRRIQYEFVNIDDFDHTSRTAASYNVIIVGGGDLFNEYFFSPKFCTFLAGSKATKYAISVGIPYESCIRYVDLFDHVILRASKDYHAVAERLTSDFVTVLPDLSNILHLETVKNIAAGSGFRIGVFPAQPLFAGNKFNMESRFAESLVHVLQQNERNVLVFVPMNTNSANVTECDEIAISNIVAKIPVEFHNRIEIHSDPNKYFQVIASLDFSICMRFHSVMLSLVFKVPMLVAYCQRKIGNLLEEEELVDFVPAYRIPTDDNDRPVAFDAQALNDLYDSAILNYETTLTALTEALPFEQQQISTIENLLRQPKKRRVGKKFVSTEFIQTKTDAVVARCLAVDQRPVDQSLYAKLIIFEATRQASSAYYYGLLNNIQKPGFDLYESVKWIVEDYYSRQVHYPLSLKRIVNFNMSYITQTDFAGVHRSGWSFVTQGLMHLNSSSDSAVLLDTYVDRTFHWAQDLLEFKKIIPYTKPWVGFIHHTFLDDYTPYSATKLFQNPLFIASLKSCRGLFTLSQYLADQVTRRLRELGFGHIAVDHLTHPTEIVSKRFEMTKFLNNRDRSIIQIGGWMRNPWGIYDLDIDEHFRLQKAVLVGKHMQSYVKPKDFKKQLAAFIATVDNNSNGCTTAVSGQLVISDTAVTTKNSTKNVFLKKFYQDIAAKLDSVITIPEKTDDDYDELLTQNIVFLNLYDASAVNTIIECAVRETPILVNRLPSVEEILGKGYPLFYKTIDEAQLLLVNSQKIREATEYLKRMDKTKFQIRYFLNDFQAKLVNMIY